MNELTASCPLHVWTTPGLSGLPMRKRCISFWCREKKRNKKQISASVDFPEIFKVQKFQLSLVIKRLHKGGQSEWVELYFQCWMIIVFIVHSLADSLMNFPSHYYRGTAQKLILVTVENCMDVKGKLSVFLHHFSNGLWDCLAPVCFC